MKRLGFTFIFIILAIVLICVGYSTIYLKYSKVIRTSKEYLTSRGYQIVSYEGKRNYILKKEQLLGLPYSIIWSVQKVKPEDYFEKSIYEYTFKVKNHPLDNIKYNNKKQTFVTVMVVDGQVIGGYSLPNYDEVTIGDEIYSLDGKTLEEVTRLSFQEWSSRWGERFK